MPFVNIKITPGAPTEQKARVIQGVTQLLVDVMDKKPETIFVVIEEVSPENWGIGGETVATLLAKAK